MGMTVSSGLHWNRGIRLQQRGGTAAFAVALACTACSGPEGSEPGALHPRSTASAEGGGTGDGKAFVSPLCAGAPWSAASDVVAAAFDANDLVVLTAAGEPRKAHHFVVPDGARDVSRTLLATRDRITASLSFMNGDQLEGSTVRLNRSGGVVWALPGIVERMGGPNDEPAASDEGMAAMTAEGRVLVRADGTSLDALPAGADSVTVWSPPDADGWLRVSWTTADGAPMRQHHGRLHLDGHKREFFSTTNGASVDYARLGDKDVYLFSTKDSSAPENDWYLAYASAERSRTELFTSSTAVGLSFLRVAGSGTTALLSAAGTTNRLWLLDGPTETWSTLSTDVPAPFDASRVAGRWSLVHRDEAPLFVIDRDAQNVTPVTVNIDALRPMEGKYCNPTTLLADGRIALGLRDDEKAAFYVGTPGAEEWQRLGEPVRDVTGFRGELVNHTWVVTAESGKDSYCPPFLPFTGEGDGMLEGDVAQILAPGAPPLVIPLELHANAPTFAVDPSGLCVAQWSAESSHVSVTDLASGGASRLPNLANFTWLP